MTKEKLEKLLVSYGVQYTDALSDKLLELLKNETHSIRNISENTLDYNRLVSIMNYMSDYFDEDYVKLRMDKFNFATLFTAVINYVAIWDTLYTYEDTDLLSIRALKHIFENTDISPYGI